MFQRHKLNRVSYPIKVCIILAIFVVSSTTHAANQIIGINVVQELPREIQVLVDYDYSGDQDTPVYLQVIMANDGQELPYFAARPAVMFPGRGQAKVILALSSNAPSQFTSNQLKVNAYKAESAPFMNRIFPFNKTWGASVSPIYIPPPGPPERPSSDYQLPTPPAPPDMPSPGYGQAEVLSRWQCGSGQMSGDYIGSVVTINKTGTSGTLSVEYNYNPSHGTAVYLGAYLLDASGQPLSAGYYPTTASVDGHGTAAVQISSDQTGVQSTQAFIWMYERNKDTAFICRMVPYTVPW